MTKPKHPKRGFNDVDPVDDTKEPQDLDLKSLMLSLSAKMDTLGTTLSNVDSRLNTKMEQLESSMSTMIKGVQLEMENRLTSFTADVNQRFSGVESSTILKCDEAMQKASNELSSRFDDMRALLEWRIDKLERLSMDKELIISGVPVEQNDNPFGVLGDICSVLKCNLSDRDFVSAYRLRPKNSNSNTRSIRSAPIVVKACGVWVKDELMSAYLKKRNLNLKDIGFQTASRIYINESLTKANREIFNLAAEAKKDGHILKYFSRNGLIHVQRVANAKPVMIHHISELIQILPLGFDRASSSGSRRIRNHTPAPLPMNHHNQLKDTPDMNDNTAALPTMPTTSDSMDTNHGDAGDSTLSMTK